jgi:hypothetical protein
MADFEIRPKSVALSGNQAQVFEAVRNGKPVPGVTWSIQPTKGSGTIDPVSGLYSSPRFVVIRRKAYVQAAVGGAQPAVGVTAGVDVLDKPSKNAADMGGQTDGETPGAEAKDGPGTTSDGHGAGGNGQPPIQVAVATVELTSIELWTQLLGAYWIVSCFLLLVLLLGLWHALCPTCRLKVSPPIVTLSASQPQMFTANTEVTWSAGVQPSGLYTAPDSVMADQRLVVTATSNADSKRSASADVFLSSDLGLYVHPQNAEVQSGCADHSSEVGCSTILVASTSEAPTVSTAAASGESRTVGQPELTPAKPGATGEPRQPAAGATSSPRIEWLPPSLGRIERVDDHIAAFHAENVRLSGKPATVMVIARIKDKASRIAGAWITILPRRNLVRLLGSGTDDCASDMFGILSLIAIMGALGGTIHGISSFTAFVGNRELKTSWVWWYFLKPFLGGAVALVVYLVFRAGFGGSDFSLGSADCLKVAALAGLIGLFAEPATLKLKDIFETLFTTKEQAARKDALGMVTLKIDSLIPETVAANQTQPLSLRILGTGFTASSQVKIGDSPLRKPAHTTPTQLDVSLAPGELKTAHDLPVVVINDGQQSNTLVLKVTEPAQPLSQPPPQGG